MVLSYQFSKYLIHSAKLKDISFIYRTNDSNHLGGSLYLGSHLGFDKEYLSKHHIGSVLTIMEGYEYHKYRIKERVQEFKELGILLKHNHIILDDPLPQCWRNSTEWISRSLQGSNTFVHCVYGKSRSPSVIAAYLILFQKMSVLKACSLIEKQRQIRFQEYWKKELTQLVN